MPLQDSGGALFAGSAAEFIDMAPRSTLTAHLVEQFERMWGHKPGASEVLSWKNSLTALSTVVDGAALQASGVGVELRLPNNSRRIDASFVARDMAGAPHVVLIELKQWSSAAPSQFADNVVVGGKELLHPSVQAASYANYLRESHSAFTEFNFGLSACAYLHNLTKSDSFGLRGLVFEGALKDAPFFASGDEQEFAGYLAQRLAGGGGLALLPTLVKGRYLPSRNLIDGIARGLRDSPMWQLLDEQLIAYNVVRGLVERAVAEEGKAVVIIRGGPGTGKSVIAAHLLIAMARRDFTAVHATGSKAFTTNLRAVSPNTATAAVFKYFNQFREVGTEPNAFDIIICDEAHRLRSTSNDRFTKAAARSTLPQVQEIVRAGRVTVFLLDERQNVRPDEIGTVESIRAAAKAEGASVSEFTLDAQFRCNGSSAYVSWVDDLLSDEPQPPGDWLKSEEYDFRVYSTPEALEQAVRDQAEAGSTARLVAGFCWPWSDPLPGGELVEDVVIGNWRRPWNEKSPEQQKPTRPAPKPGKHPYYLWATEPERIGEIGCIYSAQGFEFDYCGVILGNDLVWREGQGWVASRDASSDASVARRKLDQSRLRNLLAHTYRVLLTRGIRGTFIYSTDVETRLFLQGLVATP